MEEVCRKETTSSVCVNGQFEEWRAWVDQSLHGISVDPDFVGDGPFQDACRYVLCGAGKRLRALLAIGVCTDLTSSEKSARIAVVPAVAIEILHAASLVHDDLPIIDNDDMRRGKPSCHRAYDEATALLVGDVLVGSAFRSLSTNSVLSSDMQSRLMGVLSTSWLRLCVGQYADISEKKLSSVARQEMIRNKTGALFGAATACGAICAGVPEQWVASYYTWGLKIGEVFQAFDDIADGDIPTTELERVRSEAACLCSKDAEHLDERLMNGVSRELVSMLGASIQLVGE